MIRNRKNEENGNLLEEEEAGYVIHDFAERERERSSDNSAVRAR